MTTLASRIAVYWPLDTTHGRSLPDDYYDSLPLDTGVAPSATGKVRQCLSLDSSLSHFRSRLHHADLSQPKGACFWVKFTTLSGDMSIISKGSDATDNNTSLRVWYDHSDTDLAYTVGTGSASTTVRTDGLSLAVDTWYFVRAANDGNRMSIWVNETLYGSATAVAPLSESGALYLGRDFGGNYLNGLLDEVVVFSSSPTAADGHVFYDAGNGGTLPVPDHRVGTSGQPAVHHRYEPPTFAESGDGTAYLAQGHVPAQRISGTVARAGVPAPQTSVRPRGSGSGTMVGTVYAYSRWLDADGRVSNVSPISDATTLYGDATGTITGATNATPIVVTSASHGLLTGDRIQITGQSGNTAANGNWTITKEDANSFQLDGSSGNGDWQASAAPSLAVTVIRDGMAGASAVQTVSFPTTPTAGTFTLSFRGATTAAIAYNATATDVEEALEILTTIGAGNVTCTGGPINTTAVVVTFGLSLANEDLPVLESEYTGGSVTLAIAVVQGASSGTNEQQTLELLNTPTGGTFTLSFGGATTAAIAYDATDAAVQTALEALINIDVDDVACSGGDLPATAVTVEFTGDLAEQSVSEMTINSASLTGTGVSMAISTVTPGVPPTAWDLSVGEYDSISSNVCPGENVVGVTFKPDGTQLYALVDDGANSYIQQYRLYSPWDLTTMLKQTSRNLVIGSITSSPADLYIESTGRYLLVLGGTIDTLYEFDSDGGTAWDIRDYEWVGAGSNDYELIADDVALGGSSGRCFHIDEAENKLYAGFTDATAATSKIYQWSTSASHTMSGGGSYDSKVLDVTAAVTGVLLRTVFVRPESATIFVAGYSNDTVYEYDMSTPGDVSTGSKTSDELVLTHGESGGSGGITHAVRFRPDGKKVFAKALAGGRLYQYDISSGSSTNEVQRITTTGTPTEGTFTLTYEGETTSAIAHDASAATIDTALEALTNIGSGALTCTGGDLPGSAVDVEFSGTYVGGTDVTEMTVEDNGLFSRVATTVTGGSGSNEAITITPSASIGSGTFTLTFDGETTDSLAYNSTAADVDSALEALSTIGSGNVLCSIGPINTTYVRVEFTGTLAQTNVGAVTATTSLTAQVSSLSIVETTVGSTARNEIQELAASNVSGGTFTLTYIGQTTAALEFDATAEEVESQFQALSNIGSGQALVTGGQLTETPLRIEYVDTLGNQDVNKASVSVANLNNGGWSEGANAIRYRDVPVPTDTRVVKRQILRSKAGVNPNVVYVDIETSDVSSNRLTSNNTDADMTEAVVLLDSNGVDSNLSRHGEPPDWKRVVVGHQNRLFYLVDYVETSRVDVTTPTATGIGTDWPSVFDDRVAYDDTGSAVIDVDPDNQTGALTLTSLTAEEAAKVTIRKQRPDGQRMYHSWVTSVDSFPESVHAGEPFQFPRDPRDGEPVSAYSFDGQFFVAFEQATYRHTFAFDPAPSPSGDGRAGVAVPRGMVSSRSWASVDDNAWVMDRQGIYIFDGDALVQVSEQIKTLFTGMDGDAINWENRKWFHAAHFAAERTVRFFVTLDGGPYPRHALCCNVDQRMWWIEEYSWPITSSCEGVVAGKRTVFLGSTRRQIFTLDGLREGMSSTLTDTLRGDVTSAGTITLADTSATFSSSLVGHTIRIVKGPGIGLQREIVAVSGTTLTVKQPWTVLPTTDSTYQIAGVSWSVQTGMLRYVQNNQKPVRRVEIDYSPNTAAQNMDYRILEEFSLTEMVQKMTVSSLHTDGISMEADSSRHRLDLTQSDGHAEQDFGGISPEGVTGDRFVSVLADGTTNGERHRIHALAISGAQ